METLYNTDKSRFHFKSHENDLNFVMRSLKHNLNLTVEEENMLITRWQQENDEKAGHRILTSHIRLVAKIASTYVGYNLPLHDLIAEGNIGMLKALEKFDQSIGCRFSTYATHWIHATIKDYVLKTWSLVKMGTGLKQKKLFFKLRQMKQRFASHEAHLSEESIQKIAREMKVDTSHVIHMDQRLKGQEFSLNVSRTHDDDGQWQDWISDDTPTHDIQIADTQEEKRRQILIDEAFETLNTRELEIINSRRLKEPPETLEEISSRLNISRERVRQIEIATFHKIQHQVQARAQEIRMN